MKDQPIMDDLMELVAAELRLDWKNPLYSEDAFLDWLIKKTIIRRGARESHDLNTLAADFAERIAPRINARRLAKRLPGPE